MFVHYSWTKGSCGFGSNAPVKLVLCITCCIRHQVVVVHNLDKVMVNGWCPGFDLLAHEHSTHLREDSVGSYFCIPVVFFELCFDMDSGFLNFVFKEACKIC